MPVAKKAKPALNAAEEAPVQGRTAKRRLDRSDEVVNWRKLKVTGPPHLHRGDISHQCSLRCSLCLIEGGQLSAAALRKGSRGLILGVGNYSRRVSALGADTVLQSQCTSNGARVQGKAVKLTRSKVHSWGLSAAEPIQAEQFVIEYTGELIRLSVNAVRERKDADSDYRFRVDDQWVVDATTKVGSSSPSLQAMYSSYWDESL